MKGETLWNVNAEIQKWVLSVFVIGFKNHPGNREFSCEFCGLYRASEPRCNICEDTTSGQCVWATMLFSSGTWFRKLKYMYQEKKGKLKNEIYTFKKYC